jgi:hypothetical protein
MPRQSDLAAGADPRKTPNPVEQSAVLAILESLAAGPRAIAEIPRSWPVTRGVLRLVARRLVAEGLVETVAAPRPLLQLVSRERT